MEWDETSPCDPRYNCIAFAAGVQDKNYWPDPRLYWPPGVSKETSIKAFKELYRSFGYEECPDGTPEVGFDKVAIYASFEGKPTHAAVFREGKWRSKLGPQWDISHELTGLNGDEYGYPVVFLRRRSG
jgi:hypothetical protein